MSKDSNGKPVSVVDFLGILLRFRRQVFGLGAAIAVAAGAFALLSPEYRAQSQFVPQKASTRSALAGLAAQFGVLAALPAEDESVDFYAKLIESRELLGEVVRTKYTFPRAERSTDTLTADLISIYGVHEDSDNEALLEGVEELREEIQVSRDIRTGIVTLQSTARWPRLAEAINRRVLSAVNDFNLRKRQTRAAGERAFVESRMAQAKAELETAENDLRVFLEHNRLYRESPRLLFDGERLQRRVDLRQQVYVTLAQSYEQARVDEVRDTPVITILESPEGSAEFRSKLLRNLVVGGLLGSLVGLMAALTQVYFAEQRRRRPQEVRELEDEFKRLIPRRGGRAH